MEDIQPARSQTKPSSTALFHGIKRRLDVLGELSLSQDNILWNEPLLCANTIPWAELRWDELSWDAGRMEQIPSSLLQPSSPVILRARQMAFLK